MLAIVASVRDRVAQRLIERWASDGALLLSPQDLSRPGWCYDPVSPRSGTAVVAGTRVRVAEISAVLTRLPAVMEEDLPQIVPPDRAYVAAEMTAFLLAWLSTVPERVVNRPQPPLLSGPHWRAPHWRYAAARAGFPLAPLGAAENEREATETLLVVAGRCVESDERADAPAAVRLAAAARVDLLGIHVRPDGGAFVSADPWPDPSEPAVADALRSHLIGEPA